MFELKLFGNKTYKWENHNNCYFIGYIFDNNNNIVDGKIAIELFLSSNEEDLENFNGIYTFIKIIEEEVTIITDSINYFPIFYFKLNNYWKISDTWNYLINLKGGIQPNYNAEIEFLTAGFILNNETIDSDIFKTRTGEKLFLKNGKDPERKTIFSFLPKNFLENNFEELSKIAITELYSTGERLINFLNNRTAVVPLSGGFDSRLIVCLLKKLNYKKVICITYGVNNPEVEISHKVAENLGFKWYFIDYNKLDLDNFINEPEFLEYVKFMGNGYSMPYLQEYFAVKELTKNKLIPEDSVFLPGHSGDYLAGSYTNKTARTKKQGLELAKHIAKKYFFFRKKNRRENNNLINRLKVTLNKYPERNNYSSTFNPYIEDWDVKEKLSKFIFHSSNVFTFFGYKHWFPLWDKKLVLFFRNLPFKFRENKLLYDSIVIKEFFAPLNVYFSEKEIKTSKLKLKIQIVKDKIRYYFPWKYVQNRMIKHDWMYYSYFTNIIENQMVIKGYKPLKKYKSFCAIICRWYIDLANYYNN